MNSKRNRTLDSREFMAALESLKCGEASLLPDKISRTIAIETFTKAKKMSGGDKSEVDLKGFEWALRRMMQLVDVPIIVQFDDRYDFRFLLDCVWNSAVL